MGDVPDHHRRAPAARAPRRPPGGDHTVEFPTLARLRREPWPGRRVSRALIVANVFFTGAYVGWWLAGGHVGNPWLFWAFAAAETFTVSHLVGLWQSMWSAGMELPPPGETHFTVDVFIPTLGEPLEVLRRTIHAAVAMELPHRTYVLDDACRTEVERLASELGAEYICRRESRGAKAGNLNHALRRTDGDLIVIFDADHVPRRDFLTHLLGYFEDPTVGIVQTPQLYGNATHNPVARGSWYAQVPFYGPIMRGKHNLGTALLAGSNGIVRRAALEEVGGFREDTIVEDFVTSMALHAHGHRTVYFPYVLAEGEGPSTLRAYFRQQLRWAKGGIGALLGGEPLRPGLTWLQRIHHFQVTTAYFFGFAVAVYLALPILALLFGIVPFAASAATFLLFYVPHMGLTLLNVRHSLGGNYGLRHMQYFFGSFPVYIAAAFAAFTGVDVRFSATGAESRRARPPLAAWVTVLAFAATLGAMVAAPLVRALDPWEWVNVFWGTVNLALLWGITRTTLLEAVGRRATDDPGVPGDAAHALETDTYMLGAFDLPPLPEEVLPRFEREVAA